MTKFIKFMLKVIAFCFVFPIFITVLFGAVVGIIQGITELYHLFFQ